MTDEERRVIKEYIELAVLRSVEEFKRQGLLKDAAGVIYAEMSDHLRRYYEAGGKERKTSAALKELMRDRHFVILPLYYQHGATIEEIADRLGVDTSTVVRNKRRLCIELYAKIKA